MSVRVDDFIVTKATVLTSVTKRSTMSTFLLDVSHSEVNVMEHCTHTQEK